MEFRLLGGIEAWEGSGPVELGPARQRTVLAALLMDVGNAVPVDRLVDRVWGDRPPLRARETLYSYLSRLRRLLPEEATVIERTHGGYVLTTDEQAVDVHQFSGLLARARQGADDERAAELFGRALALWRGEPFAGVDTPWFNETRATLGKERLAAELEHTDIRLRLGEHAALVTALSERTTAHPLDERLAAQYMLALYRCGRQADALGHYRLVRDTIADELGLEPGPELRELQRRILAGENADGRDEPPVPREVPAQLPVDVRGFVGRDAELAELDALSAAEVPVVISAVAGTAGVGKTALAVRWAHRVRDRYPDGQLYVDLRGYGPDEPVSAADALAGFLRALGVDGAAIPEDLAERAARFRTLVDQRRILVLLDNARTVDQVRPLLPASLSCFTLVTSRDSLTGLVAREGAHRIELDRLPLPDAVSLLRELLGTRADAEPAAVATLVERCARLPLALRITAELIRSRPGRSVNELAGELAQAQDTLDLLDIDGDPHTAVRAVFSWSYQQLDPAAARIFRLLGLHPGHDTDTYAVAATAGTGLRDTRRALDVLVRAHLVDQTPTGRYQPHDLLRAYAAELAETTERAAALTRLFGYYLATTSAAMDVIVPHETARRPKIAAPDTETPVCDTYEAAFDWLDAERANLLAVTQHAEPGYVIKMSDTVWRYLNMAGCRDDAIVLHTHALHAARDLGDLAAEANARRVLAIALRWAGFTSAAMQHMERALDLYGQVGDRWSQAATMNNLGNLHWTRGKLAAATDCLRHALALFDELGDQRMSTPAMDNLAQILSTLGRHDEARRLFERGLAIVKDNGDQGSEVSMLCGLAQVNVRIGHYQPALDHAQQALMIARTTGYRSIESFAMRMLGSTHCRLGEYEVGARYLDSAVRIARAVGDVDDIVASLSELAAGHAIAGNLAQALRHYHEALTENGQALREDYADVHMGIADIHARLDEVDQAREHWQRALTIYRELGMPHADEVATKLGHPEATSA